MTLGDLLEKIDKAQEAANIEPTVGDPRSKAGREMLKNSGLRDLENLTAQYKKFAIEHATYVLPNAYANEFAAVASEIADAVTVSLDGLYDELVETFWDSMGERKVLGGLQEAVFNKSFETFMKSIEEDPVFIPFVSGTTFSSRNEAVEYVRSKVASLAGELPAIRRLQKVVGESTLKARYTGTSTLVIVTGGTPRAQEAFSKELGRPLYAVNPKEEPTEESVAKTLKALAKKVKETQTH